MPLLIDVDSRVNELVAAINHLLVLEGPTGLTMRRIAAVSGISPSSMLHHLGSREHMIRVVAVQTARTRRADISLRARREGALAFLPATSEHVLDARAWLAWLEIWRCEETLERWITEERAEERSLLARILDYRLSREDLGAVIAIIDGLTVALCAPRRPMALPEARQTLTRQLGLLGCSDVTLPDQAVSSW